MTQDDRLQSIDDKITIIQTTLTILVTKFETVETRGCKASMDKINDVEHNLEKNFREHTFIKGIAYTFGGLGALFGYIIHYFKKG